MQNADEGGCIKVSANWQIIDGAKHYFRAFQESVVGKLRDSKVHHGLRGVDRREAPQRL